MCIPEFLIPDLTLYKEVKKKKEATLKNPRF